MRATAGRSAGTAPRTRSFPDPVGKAKFGDQVYELYVDFDAELPDLLFEPPAPGRIH